LKKKKKKNDSSSFVLDSLARWDGVYFIRLAETHMKYEYELFHAFFPLLPYTIDKIVQSIFTHRKKNIHNNRSEYVVVGVVVTNLCFIFATIMLYKLTLLIYGANGADGKNQRATAATHAHEKEKEKEKEKETKKEKIGKKAYYVALLFMITPGKRER
jgi:hypothetical protein